MLRSLLAVLAGIAVLTVASFAIEMAVDLFFPRFSASGWFRVVTSAYGLLCVAAGGYVAGRIARRLPVPHAIAMGVVQAGLTIVAMFSPEAIHATRLQWTLIAICSIPAAALGGVFNKGARSNEGLAKAPARA